MLSTLQPAVAWAKVLKLICYNLGYPINPQIIHNAPLSSELNFALKKNCK
ncbi:hypothetical protein N824_29055 [Pedobacter sp. V48]|nr:hypothetical protein N824_29055 [Pedobacter sp. V48]